MRLGFCLALLFGCGDPKAAQEPAAQGGGPGGKDVADMGGDRAAGNGADEAGDKDKAALETGEFHGIRYAMPPGTNVANSGVDRPSHYPDENGNVVEIPTRIEPAISLTGGAEGAFFMVEIKKPPERVTLDGMISGMGGIPQASKFAGKPEPSGWSLTYQWRSDDGSSVTMHHRHYALADSDYDCVFDEGNTKAVATAQAICASIQPRPQPAR
jgi:hypothetical protein